MIDRLFLLLTLQVGDCSLFTLSVRLLNRRLPALVKAGSERILAPEPCLHAFAAAVIYGTVMAMADPVFKPGPAAAADIAEGTRLRLYDLTNSRCVAIGVTERYTHSTWGDTLIPLTGARATRQEASAQQRIVVRIAETLVPGAVLPYKMEQDLSTDPRQRRTLDQLGEAALVLWNLVCTDSRRCHEVLCVNAGG